MLLFYCKHSLISYQVQNVARNMKQNPENGNKKAQANMNWPRY